MVNDISKQAKALIAENRLEEALDLALDSEQHASAGRQHSLLLLKGQLAMIREQELAGLLDLKEAMQQRAKIARSLLKLLDEKPVAPANKTLSPTAQLSTGSPVVKYILLGALVLGVLLGGFFFMKTISKSGDADPAQQDPSSERPMVRDEKQQPARPASPIQLQDFPMLGQPFNFSDIRYTFREADVEDYADGQIKLILKMNLECRSNLGVCYREEIRILADDKPIAPAERENLDGWLAHRSTAGDVQVFILDTAAKTYHIELSKNNSTWKRGFGLLR